MPCMDTSQAAALSGVHRVSPLFLADPWLLGLDPGGGHHGALPAAAGMGDVRLPQLLRLLLALPLVLPLRVPREQQFVESRG